MEHSKPNMVLFKGISKNSEFAQMQGAQKILVPANLFASLIMADFINRKEAA